MNYIKYLLIAVLLSSSVLAASVPQFVSINTTGTMFMCLQVIQQNQTLIAKANIEVDKSEYTNRDCVAGVKIALEYDRNIWLNNMDKRGCDGTSSDNDCQANNYLLWNSVFLDPKGNDIASPQKSLVVRNDLDGFSNPLSRINSHIANDIDSKTIIQPEDAFYYYGLAENSLFFSGGIGTMNLRNDGVLYDVSDCENNIACNYYHIEPFSNYVSNTLRYCMYDKIYDNATTGYGTCKAGAVVDFPDGTLDTMPKRGRSYYFFNPMFNYYYYPMSIKSLVIKVNGYDSANASKNLVYTKSTTINPTSNEIKISAKQMLQATHHPVFTGDPNCAGYLNDLCIDGYAYVDSSTGTLKGLYDDTYDTTIKDNLFFGSKLQSEQKLADVPSGVVYVEVSYSLNMNMNPMYRHKSVVDSIQMADIMGNYCDLSYYYINLTTSLNLLSLCDTRNFYSGWYIKSKPDGLFKMYLNNGTSTFPQINLSLINNNDINLNDSSQSSYGSLTDDFNGVGNNGSGTFGTDWSGEMGSSGGLENLYVAIQQQELIAKKSSFFLTLYEIQRILMIIFLTIYTVIIFALTLIIFFVMMPSAYRKFLGEFKKLINQRWK